jgi:hypothetical protein
LAVAAGFEQVRSQRRKRDQAVGHRHAGAAHLPNDVLAGPQIVRLGECRPRPDMIPAQRGKAKTLALLGVFRIAGAPERFLIKVNDTALHLLSD